MDLTGLLGDLRAESEELDGLVADLDEHDWRRETPAPGWTVAHQIAHLAWTDEKALLAATDQEGFRAEAEAAPANTRGYVERGAERGAREASAELLERWREGRKRLSTALAATPESTRLPWFGPSMSVASMVTARLMETWAHGQDVADALGVTRTPSPRLRHIARIGVRTRDFAYGVHGLQPPPEEFRVELTGPDGDAWHWGPPHAQQRVTGPALDFCLLVTQRRHLEDTALRAVGSDALQWVRIAQAFAGPPGQGRAPGQFA
ncbi:uncharacterized protein (TIGR03084 family) [Halopolyspora algeriensis]|uniref:Uncharacterized protein (TIGR03084 family) n=1 Tax=Halopolyspora algeriensis TaxID=1500506 RepID=A0A368VUY4_9ACTN|nr:TIGR03084 family metal-binding protein [Halopolyspora algeriensis]RCW45906.1 uncharacterized protein (TIGR03084 family) [Halopolyspora algeriensis]TQM55320.1 uncharacterized protein (TIGR03084 family) [Halopolyspora algeriensis]